MHATISLAYCTLCHYVQALDKGVTKSSASIQAGADDAAAQLAVFTGGLQEGRAALEGAVSGTHAADEEMAAALAGAAGAAAAGINGGCSAGMT